MDAGDGEKLDEAGDVGGSAEDLEFFGELAVDVVEVAAGLEVGVAEAAEGGEGLVVAAFLEEPAGGFCVWVVSGGDREREREVPGQRKMKSVRGTAGRNAEPSWRRHAFLPIWKRMRLALKPSMMPNAV